MHKVFSSYRHSSWVSVDKVVLGSGAWMFDLQTLTSAKIWADLLEAQLMPPEDSPVERTFLSLNTVLAIIFFFELSVSLFARSDNLYRDFWKDSGQHVSSAHTHP